MRRSLVRAIRYFVLKPSAMIGWLVGVVVVIALVAAVPMLLPSVPGLSSLRSQSAPQSTEAYLRGNRDYNADLVWNSLNNDAQSRLSDGGGSLTDLQQQMDTAKTKGVKLEEASYIGGKSLPDGTSMQFYLVGIRQQTRSDIDYQPYMFTLDRDGKIAKVQ
ncbi:MAG TPA: hypothetical protein VGQ62_05125 [Chloroflexota bacterium]|nr:hypothetical protein [Chloroflexota bacterium]